MTLQLTYANFEIIQLNLSYGDFSNLGEISLKNEI